MGLRLQLRGLRLVASSCMTWDAGVGGGTLSHQSPAAVLSGLQWRCRQRFSTGWGRAPQWQSRWRRRAQETGRAKGELWVPLLWFPVLCFLLKRCSSYHGKLITRLKQTRVANRQRARLLERSACSKPRQAIGWASLQLCRFTRESCHARSEWTKSERTKWSALSLWQVLQPGTQALPRFVNHF